MSSKRGNLDSFFKPADSKKVKTDAKKIEESVLKSEAKKERLILFAHGAGANSSSEWMVQWAKMLGQYGYVHTFDYPGMQGKKNGPGNKNKNVEAHIEALQEAIDIFAKENNLNEKGKAEIPIFLAGKSMGSRLGCMVAAKSEFNVKGVICLGYPLRDTQDRVQTLLEVPVPVMFVQGTKDNLCDIDELEKVRKNMTAYTDLYKVETGDHSLKIQKRYAKQVGTTQEKSDNQVLAAIGAFIEYVSQNS